jgi:hypothetical protein
MSGVFSQVNFSVSEAVALNFWNYTRKEAAIQTQMGPGGQVTLLGTGGVRPWRDPGVSLAGRRRPWRMRRFRIASRFWRTPHRREWV